MFGYLFDCVSNYHWFMWWRKQCIMYIFSKHGIGLLATYVVEETMYNVHFFQTWHWSISNYSVAPKIKNNRLSIFFFFFLAIHLLVISSTLYFSGFSIRMPPPAFEKRTGVKDSCTGFLLAISQQWESSPVSSPGVQTPILLTSFADHRHVTVGMEKLPPKLGWIMLNY